MKKIYLFTLLIFSCLSSYAQLDKGTVMLGGGLGADLYTMKGNLESNRDYTYLNLQGAYFLKSRFAIGLEAGYAVSSLDNRVAPDLNMDLSLRSFRLMPFVRTYKMWTENFGMFGQAGLFLDKGTFVPLKGEDLPLPGTQTEYGVRLNGGVLYFLGKRLAVELLMGSTGFSTMSQKYNGDVYKASGIYLGATTEVSVGFRWYLNPAKSKD